MRTQGTGGCLQATERGLRRDQPSSEGTNLILDLQPIDFSCFSHPVCGAGNISPSKLMQTLNFSSCPFPASCPLLTLIPVLWLNISASIIYNTSRWVSELQGLNDSHWRSWFLRRENDTKKNRELYLLTTETEIDLGSFWQPQPGEGLLMGVGGLGGAGQWSVPQAPHTCIWHLPAHRLFTYPIVGLIRHNSFILIKRIARSESCLVLSLCCSIHRVTLSKFLNFPNYRLLFCEMGLILETFSSAWEV